MYPQFSFETDKPEVFKEFTHPDFGFKLKFSNHGRLFYRDKECKMTVIGTYNAGPCRLNVRALMLAYRYNDSRPITATFRPIYKDGNRDNLTPDNIELPFDLECYYKGLPEEKWLNGSDGYEYSSYGRRRLESSKRISNESIGLTWIKGYGGWKLTGKDISEIARRERQRHFYKAMRLFNKGKLPKNFKVIVPTSVPMEGILMDVHRACEYAHGNRKNLSE